MFTSGSGSPAFDKLREALQVDVMLRGELEAALDLNVQRINPTDRANRFGSGAAVEWILAAVAFAAGVLAVPAGHNANGFDLRDIRNQARGLWSVKNTTKRSDFRMTNGIGGAGAGLQDPVVFLSPALPGLTFMDPNLHTELAAALLTKADATVLPFGAVERHARSHPECVAECRMPTNPGTGGDDPWMDYVESLLTQQRFPRLSRLFVRSKPVGGTLASQVQELVTMRDGGQLTEEQFAALVRKLAP